VFGCWGRYQTFQLKVTAAYKNSINYLGIYYTESFRAVERHGKQLSLIGCHWKDGQLVPLRDVNFANWTPLVSGKTQNRLSGQWHVDWGGSKEYAKSELLAAFNGKNDNPTNEEKNFLYSEI